MQTHNMKLSMSKFDLTDALMIVGLSPFTALKFAAIVSVELSSRNHLVAATLHLSMGLFNPLPPPPPALILHSHSNHICHKKQQNCLV